MSIWKPADRTESLHTILTLQPDGGSAGRSRQHKSSGSRDSAEEEKEERKTKGSATVKGGNQEGAVLTEERRQTAYNMLRDHTGQSIG